MKYELVEHGFNGRSEVVVFVAPLPGTPVSWRPDGVAGVWIRQPGHLDRPMGISPDVRTMAERHGSLLLVEVDPAERRTSRVTWIPMLDD